jgi:Holliday junction resolvase RusA-like endonuclease
MVLRTASAEGDGVQLALIDEATPLVISPDVFVRFELPGEPVAKARHRSRIMRRKDTGLPFILQYPDPDTVKYEDALRQVASIAMRSRAPATGPVALLVHAFVPIPKSWTMREKADARSGAALPTGKPDWDNYGKITDALKGVVWRDDASVVDGRVIKRFSDHPAFRVEVRLFVPRGLSA